jgi:hypothetical protein
MIQIPGKFQQTQSPTPKELIDQGKCASEKKELFALKCLKVIGLFCGIGGSWFFLVCFLLCDKCSGSERVIS